MACPHCGSWSVKADRSLAGRLVCGRCGRPLGVKDSRRAAQPGKRRQQPLTRLRLPWWAWLAALVAVSAGLASRQPPPPLPMPFAQPSNGAVPWR
jgi:hypothetical protein